MLTLDPNSDVGMYTTNGCRCCCLLSCSVSAGCPLARDAPVLSPTYTPRQLATVLHEQYHLPSDLAVLSTQTFLRNFRLCPDNGKTNLVEWRRLLWAQALGEEYAELAGEVSMRWLQLRYLYLNITPEVSSLLYELRHHYLLGLITNGPSHAQWEKVQQLNLRQYFDCILVSGDLPWEKPNQNIFLEACQYLGVQPRQCLMVGDKLETDIQGGKEASLGATVWIPLNGEIAAEQGPCPDYILGCVTELPRLLPSKPKLQRCINPLPDLEDCNSNASDGS